MIVNDITTYLETYFPLHLQEAWDTCGLQIGTKEQAVSRVMIGLNADVETLQKAISENCDMLITHHPFMLENIKTIDFNHYHGKFIKMAIENKVAVYSLHTCLDKGKNGISMNDWLANALQLVNVCPYDAIGIGKKGKVVQAVDVEEWISIVKSTFSIPCVSYNRGIQKRISSVAICGGSAADDIMHLHTQVDCFITGDTKHKHMKFAIDNNIVLLDIGHHAEVIMEKEIKKLLDTLDVEVVVANSQDYYIYK